MADGGHFALVAAGERRAVLPGKPQRPGGRPRGQRLAPRRLRPRPARADELLRQGRHRRRHQPHRRRRRSASAGLRHPPRPGRAAAGHGPGRLRRRPLARLAAHPVRDRLRPGHGRFAPEVRQENATDEQEEPRQQRRAPRPDRGHPRRHPRRQGQRRRTPRERPAQGDPRPFAPLPAQARQVRRPLGPGDGDDGRARHRRHRHGHGLLRPHAGEFVGGERRADLRVSGPDGRLVPAGEQAQHPLAKGQRRRRTHLRDGRSSQRSRFAGCHGFTRSSDGGEAVSGVRPPTRLALRQNYGSSRGTRIGRLRRDHLRQPRLPLRRGRDVGRQRRFADRAKGRERRRRRPETAAERRRCCPCCRASSSRKPAASASTIPTSATCRWTSCAGR